MEFSLCSLDCAIPVEVTLDEDNGRYMIRKSDTSGEVFNSAQELIEWVKTNFQKEEFCDQDQFVEMLNSLAEYANNPQV